jgi:RNA polymerase sigma-70 factor (ECF subfamily)
MSDVMGMAVGEVAGRVTASLPADLDEIRLVHRAQRGDRPAFEQLYRQHVGRIHATCLRLCAGRLDLAEDATQEAFIAAWRALPNFAERSRFGTWLHRIAVNTVLQRDRPRARHLELSEEDSPTTPDRAVHDSSPALDLEAAIAALPGGARHVLVLVALYGYSHEECAELLGIAAGTSKAQLNRARRLLTERLVLETP